MTPEEMNYKDEGVFSDVVYSATQLKDNLEDI